jgi:hypothetical protein
MRIIFIFILIILLLIIIQVILIHLDKDRIADAVEKNGWKILSMVWRPFSPGWIGERNERQYEVNFIDENGIQRKRICKTSLLTGLYWRDE